MLFNDKTMNKKAILLGASGITGNSLLLHLLENRNFSDILIVVRRELRIQHPKLKQLIIDFDRMNDYRSQISGDTVFCCLGSTKAKTPDENEYRKIDCEYPAQLGSIALENGAESFHLVSFIKANKNASNLYMRIKGISEEYIRAIAFPAIHIYRPMLFDTPRNDKHFKESFINLLMQGINPILLGGLRKYRSIKVEHIARAMIRCSLEDQKGVFIHDSGEIQLLSRDSTD